MKFKNIYDFLKKFYNNYMFERRINKKKKRKINKRTGC